MATIIVLGGSGAVGRVAVKTLAAHPAFKKVIIGDIELDKANALVQELSSADVTALHVDVGDPASIKAAVEDVDVVLNCTGPFYQYAVPVLEAVLDAGVLKYVDVCDDVDATLELLEMDAQLRAVGAQALIGMGNSPGVTNLLARLASDFLLDETEFVDIYHAHGGEAFEGPGVVAHRFHGMAMDIPMFLEGELKSVRFFEPEGLALRTEVSMHLLGEGIKVYPYPHPEQITIPKHLSLQRVTNRGTVLPDDYFQLTAELARLGFTDKTPLSVGGQTVTPHDFAIAYLLRQREEILREANFKSQCGCTKVVVGGVRHGKPRQYIFSMASADQALGEGTGIPAAMGAILMRHGNVSKTGVMPPEAAIAPMDFLALMKPILELTQRDKSFEGLLVEKVDEHGKTERVDLPF